MTLSPADVAAARTRIASGIYLSPCPESIPLSEIAGCRVYCKLDYLQRTGSFKERGRATPCCCLTKTRGGAA